MIDNAMAISTGSKQHSINSAAASAESVGVLWLGESLEDAILFVRSRSGDVESARKLVEDQLEEGRGDTTRTWLDDGGAVNHAPDGDTDVRCGRGELAGCSSGELHVLEDRRPDWRVNNREDVA